MHLIVPFASPLSDAGREALSRLATPALDALLSRWIQTDRDEQDEWSSCTPHERALARCLGWSDAAPLPWAARSAHADGVDVADRPWGLLTPVHWRVGSDAIHLVDPAQLDLDETASRTLLEAVRPWFESEGFALAWGAPQRWYAAHPTLATLRTASLDRVVGRNVDRWLPAQTQARLVRRLQNEMQMLLHTHPLNAEREAAGRLPVNSFWLWGCGVRQAEASNDAQLDDRLRAPALAEDWVRWAQAWAALDASLASQPPTRLTLCGERGSITFSPVQRSLVERVTHSFKPKRPARDHLATL